ncbi:MAG: hypothetical protein A2806_03460 [Candidatus Terrybacteria bacterium RIFCSPHIGHO2_01_FULL_48_17]|uniref:Methyltransferase type 11 domain-containing protein n=1 Tax=Candidatus Terrybacteria bacterium RIFCSPHIGHO2_01_FULL_48_17 TaxID=1802362 RepID=A0A1G2PH26_9BACT|nr:MAG: hypothetical protein A2806_03460 [Candidatus Terrybacteria bacterium RIFCSPHIGHO2_01_FULL_48_17]
MGQFECFRGRHFSVYEQGMNASMRMKWRDIAPWVVAPEYDSSSYIVEEGCGTGGLLLRLGIRFATTPVIGRDISSHFAQTSAEAVSGLANTAVIQENILKPRFASGSVGTKIFSSVWHELYSYNGYREDVLDMVLEQTYRELIPGGRIIIRDGVKPKNQHVAMWLSPKSYGNLPSAREMFMRFVRDFQAVRPVPYGHLQTNDYQLFAVLGSENAYEFLMKKDYLENWEGEIKEVFGVWTPQEFEQRLISHGFRPLCIKPFRNRWIVEHRLKPVTKLYRFGKKGELITIPFPYTNILVVGEKSK